MSAAPPLVRRHADEKELARAAADEIATQAREAVERRGRFSLALAGGSTPRRLYELLVEAPYREGIDWSKVELFWSDERAVGPDHPASNFRMAREALLDKLALRADQVHRMPAERADLDAAAREYQAEIARFFGTAPRGAAPSFDVVLLGMGPDAHTASLFPGSAALAERQRWVVHARASAEPVDRLTFTFPLLNAAQLLLMLVAGAAKAPPLAEVLEGPRDPVRLPSQALEPRSGRLVWLVDAAAASRLAHVEDAHIG